MPNDERACIQRVLFRAPSKDGLTDVMECGHVLPVRPTLTPIDSIGARLCEKCKAAAPIQMTFVPKIPRATKERLYWAWWYETRHGRSFPMEKVKEILRG